MRKYRLPLGVVLLSVLVVGTSMAKKKQRRFEAELSGLQETPLTLSVPGQGEFEAELNAAGTMLTFSLKYSDLTGPALFSHVHLGRPAITGGVSFFICGGGGKPACPPGTSGTVTGTVVAADIIGPTGQGIAAGEFDKVIQAMRAGATYVNIHTASFTGGEIRGQINNDDNHGKGHDDDDDDDPE